MKGGFIRVNKSLGKYVFSRYEISIFLLTTLSHDKYD